MLPPPCKRSPVIGLIWALGLASPLLAEPPTTWTWELYTQGDDVQWQSPTAVDNGEPRYMMAYVITELTATVQYLFLPPFDVDGMPYLDPDVVSQRHLYYSSLPIIVYDGWFGWPEYPQDPALAFSVGILVDEQGYGRASIWNVYLGYYDLAPLGEVKILAIRVGGSFTVLPTRPGDTNCDGLVNAFDIDPFVLAVTDSDGYVTAFPECDLQQADCCEDGYINAFDIDPFVAAVIGR